MSRAGVRALLERHGLAAHRDRGQNFLTSEDVAGRLVTHAGVEPGDAVIEIGPGLGILTRALAARARRVVALEIDAGLVRVLRDESLLPPNVVLEHADALDVDLVALARSLGPPVRVVANLPYAASSPILRRLLDARSVLLDWSVMLQRELAERVWAGPGEPGYGSLAVLHALTVSSSRGIDLAPADFFPAPRVHSRFFRLSPRRDVAPLDDETLRRVEAIARAAFGQRRKQIVNALRAGAGGPAAATLLRALAECGIDPRARAESLPAPAFVALAAALARERAA